MLFEALMSMIAVAAPLSAATVEPRTPAAVIAADQAWGDAEIRGDGDFLERLLMPAYQSIGIDGKATSGTAIIASARKRGASPERAASVAAWKAAHPLRAEVKIVGNTAILTWISTKAGSGEPVSSCDIFVYDHGRWRALYSQHSTANA